MLAKHREMQKHVAVELIADQKTEPARGIEPFDAAANRRKLIGMMLGGRRTAAARQ